MPGFVVSILLFLNYFIGVYFIVANFMYTLLLVVSIPTTFRHIRKVRYRGIDELASSPRIPPISVIIPAYNEEGVITQSVQSALSLNYPHLEVIVINDGSTDQTLGRLFKAFHLRPVDLIYHAPLEKRSRIHAFYTSPDIPNLLVVDKAHSGKSDSLNLGIHIARFPYFCSIDADAILEADGLLRMIAPFMDDPQTVAACGVVRVVNGCTVEAGRVRKIRLPGDALSVFQIVEYIRGFLFGRLGWSALNALLVMSGAFSLFHRETVVRCGGYSPRTVTEDMELVVRLHRLLKKEGVPYKIRFVPDTICWTEGPREVRMLGRQRRRWQRGLMESLWLNRGLFFAKRSGTAGWIGMPHQLAVEGLGPLVESLGYVLVPLAYFLGLLNIRFFYLMVILALVYGIFLSFWSIFLEDVSYRRYQTLWDLAKLLFYSVLENFSYRQLTLWFRLRGVLQFLLTKRKWEAVEYKGVVNDA